VRFMLARAKEARAAELVTLDAHGGRVINAAFSPDGKRLLTSGQDTAAHVWDAATGRELFTLRDHAPPVMAAWSSRGEIATGDGSGQLRLWSRDGQLIASFWKPEPGKPGKPPIVTALAFTRDGARVAVGKSDGTIAVGDPHQGQLPAWKQDASSVDALAFDPAGQRIAVSTSEAGKVGIWTVDGQLLHRLSGHTSSVWHVVFDAAGERVITASIDRTARVWDAGSGQLLHRLVGHEDRLTNIAVDSRSRRIATASADTTVRIWSLDTGELLTTLHGHTSQVNGVVFARDEQLITASSDGTARVWDLALSVQTAVYHHGGFLSRVALDPSGERLATASWAGTAKIWDLRRQSRLAAYAAPRAGGDARLLRSEVHAGRLARIDTHGIAAWDLASGRSWTWPQGKPVVAGALSADGRTAVAVDVGGTLHVLDADGRSARELPVGPGITSVAVYPGGQRAVTSGPRGEIAIWDLATQERLASRSLGAVNALKLSADGRVMVAFEQTSDLSGKATAWLLHDGLAREIRLDHETSLPDATFSPDGSRLVTLGQDGGARVWTTDGRLEATLKHPGPVGFAAWSSDGSWLATGTYGGTLTIWTRADWQARKQIEAHTNFITALTIGDHDSLIASAGGDGIVKIWDAAQLFQVGRIPSGSGVSALAIERDQLLIAGPLATQSWRCDR